MKRSNIPLGMTEAVKIAFKGGKSQEIQRKFAQNLKLTENVYAVEILEVGLSYYCLGFILIAS